MQIVVIFTTLHDIAPLKMTKGVITHIQSPSKFKDAFLEMQLTQCTMLNQITTQKVNFVVNIVKISSLLLKL